MNNAAKSGSTWSHTIIRLALVCMIGAVYGYWTALATVSFVESRHPLNSGKLPIYLPKGGSPIVHLWNYDKSSIPWAVFPSNVITYAGLGGVVTRSDTFSYGWRYFPACTILGSAYSLLLMALWRVITNAVSLFKRPTPP